MTLTIELKPETENHLKKRASAQGCEVDEYVRKLIEEDSNKLRTNEEVFAPCRENVEKSGVSEEKMDEIFTKTRKEAADEEILGLWADRKESVEEIARELRNGWNRNKKNG